MALLASFLAYPILLLFPGVGLARVFLKKSQRSPVTWALFSLVATPPLITLISLIFPLRDRLSLALVFLALTLGAYLLGRRIPEEKKLEFPLPSFSRRRLGLLLLLSFFIAFLAAFPRRGLLDRTSLLGSGDEPKHLEVVTSIATLGFPPQNHARPTERLVYYYYDYVYPGALAKILPYVTPMQAWLAHTFWQTALQSLLLFGIAFLYLKRIDLAFAALVLVNFVGGFDYFVSQNRAIGIDYWMDTVPMSVRNLQISLPTTLLGFVPQHFFAAVVSFAIPAILFFARGEKWLKWVLAGIVLGALPGFSAFVFLGWATGFAVYSVFQLRRIKSFLTTFAPTAAISLIVFLPFMLLLFGNPNLFRLRAATYFPLADLPLPLLVAFSLPIYLILEMNILPIFAFASLLLPLRKERNFSYLASQTLVLPLTLFFIATEGSNDYALRGVIPAQIGMAVLFLLTVTYLSRRVKAGFRIMAALILGGVFLAGVASAAFAWFALETKKIPIEARYREIAEFVPEESVVFYDGQLPAHEDERIVLFSLPTFSNRLIYVAGGQFVLRGGYEIQYLPNDVFLKKILPEGNWLTFNSIADFCPFLDSPLGNLSTFALVTGERQEWQESFPSRQVDGYFLVLIPTDEVLRHCEPTL